MSTKPAPSPSSPLAQIRRLAGTLSFREAVGLYLDEWVGALLRPIPGLLGATLRFAYYRFAFARLGGFCFIRPGARISYSSGMSVGRNLHLNGGTFIDARGGLTLGDHVLIGPNVSLLTSQHQWADPTLPIVVQGHVMASTRVGDDVWIGANAVILPGVTLASGTVVGAGAVVHEDTEPYSIVGGIPARPIGSRPPPPGFTPDAAADPGGAG